MCGVDDGDGFVVSLMRMRLGVGAGSWMRVEFACRRMALISRLIRFLYKDIDFWRCLFLGVGGGGAFALHSSWLHVAT